MRRFLCLVLLVYGGLGVSERAGAGEPPAPGKTVRTDSLGDPLPEGALQRLGTRRLCHAGEVWSVLFTPDGKSLISSGPIFGGPIGDSAIRIWDIATGKLLRSFGTQHGCGHLVLGPDGHTLAGECPTAAIYLFDLRTGKSIGSITRPEGARGNVIALAFTPDGKALASIGAESRIQFWDVPTRKVLREFGGGEGGVAIVIAPDGKSIASADAAEESYDVVLREAATGKELWRSLKSGGGFHSLAFAPDGKTLAGGGSDGEIRLWTVAMGTTTHRYRGHKGEIHAVAFSPDGKLLASGGEDRTVRLWDVASGKALRTLRGHTGAVYSVAFSPDGKTLASGSYDYSVRLWDVATGSDKLPFPGHRAMIHDFALAPDGKTITTFGTDETLRMWSLSSGRELKRIPTTEKNGYLVAYAPDSWLLSSVTPLEIGRIFDPTSPFRHFVANGSPCVFSPDGRALVTNDYDGSICLWRRDQWKEVWRVRLAKDEWCMDVAFSPDNKTLALTVSRDGGGDPERAVRLLDAKTGREIRRMTRIKRDWIEGLSYSPDGRHVAVSYDSDEKAVSLWDAATGKEVCRVGEQNARIRHMAFSPDGRFLVLAYEGNILQEREYRIVEVASGRPVRRLRPGEDGVDKVAYTPDGRRFVTHGWFTIVVWDATGQADAALPRRLVTRELQGLWDVLLSDDAPRAYAAVWRLAAAENAIAFVGEQLRPAPAISRKDVARWIVELDDEDFAVREAATMALVRLNESVAPDLRKALQGKPSEEARRRLEKLLTAAESPLCSGERLRTLRAVTVLEYAPIAEARTILERLAKGAPEARLTQDAQGALQRLARRTGEKQE